MNAHYNACDVLWLLADPLLQRWRMLLADPLLQRWWTQLWCLSSLHLVVELCQGVTTDRLLLGHLQPPDGSGITSVSDLGLGGGFPSEQWPGSLLCQLYSTVLQCPIFCVSMDMAVIDVCFLSSESKGHFLQYALQDCGLGPSCGGHESDKISLFWSLFHRSLILPNKPRDTNNLSQSPFPCQGKKKPSWQIVFPSKHLGARDEHPLDLGVTVGIWTHICLWWAPWWASSRRPPRHFAWDSDWLISSWFRI